MPPTNQSDLNAFVLAGGKSLRMGRDKSALTLENHTLLEHAIALAHTVSSKVRVCGPKDRFGADAIEDTFPGCGPLAGIHAALAGSNAELNLILAVDTPFLSRQLVEFIVSAARRTWAVVTVPFVSGRFQPLCAVYRREFGEIAERALREGRYKIDPLYGETTVRQIGEPELTALAFDARMFDNLNTPEEFEQAQKRT